MNHVYTIGHSNHDVETFFGLLSRHSVDLLVDVRSKPYSNFAPQFNLEQIRQEVGKRFGHGLYICEGDVLGGLPASVYELRKDDPVFKAAIRRVVTYTDAFTACLMCTEAGPGRCHRHTVLVPALEREGLGVRHILTDGTALEPHDIDPEPVRRKLF